MNNSELNIVSFSFLCCTRPISLFCFLFYLEPVPGVWGSGARDTAHCFCFFSSAVSPRLPQSSCALGIRVAFKIYGAFLCTIYVKVTRVGY